MVDVNDQELVSTVRFAASNRVGRGTDLGRWPTHAGEGGSNSQPATDVVRSQHLREGHPRCGARDAGRALRVRPEAFVDHWITMTIALQNRQPLGGRHDVVQTLS